MIDFLAGANLMSSIGSVAAPAASGFGSMASAFMPTISGAAAAGEFGLGALGGGLGIGSGLGIMGSPGGFNALTQGGIMRSPQGGLLEGGLLGERGLLASATDTNLPVESFMSTQPGSSQDFAKAAFQGRPLPKDLNINNFSDAPISDVGKGAAKASKGFLGMSAEQQAFWEFMAGDVIAPLANQIAGSQIEEEKDDEGHVIGYKYNDLGRALSAVGGLSSSFTLGSQAFNKLMSLKAPGDTTGTDGVAPSGKPKIPKPNSSKKNGKQSMMASYAGKTKWAS